MSKAFFILLAAVFVGTQALSSPESDQGLAILLENPNFEYSPDSEGRPFEAVTDFEDHLILALNEDTGGCRIVTRAGNLGWPCRLQTRSVQLFRGEATEYDVRIRTTVLANLALRHINLFRPESLPLSYEALVDRHLLQFVRGTHPSSPSFVRFLTLTRHRRFQRNQDANCEMHTPILRDLGRSLRLVTDACRLVGPIRFRG